MDVGIRIWPDVKPDIPGGVYERVEGLKAVYLVADSSITYMEVPG